jgi:hypothetical protein
VLAASVIYSRPEKSAPTRAAKGSSEVRKQSPAKGQNQSISKAGNQGITNAHNQDISKSAMRRERRKRNANKAVSPLLNKFFLENPTDMACRFAARSMEPEAVKELLITWFQNTLRGFTVRPLSVSEKVGADFAIISAAKVLGMERYVLVTSTEETEDAVFQTSDSSQ